MHYPLRDHLIFLQGTLRQLNARLTQPGSEAKRAEIEAQIESATKALDHYRRAYELESSLGD